MQIGIYTIKDTLYKGEAEKVIAKTTTGEITVLKDHIPLVSTLVAGPVRIISKNAPEKILEIKAGVIEVRPENQIVILAS